MKIRFDLFTTYIAGNQMVKKIERVWHKNDILLHIVKSKIRQNESDS